MLKSETKALDYFINTNADPGCKGEVVLVDSSDNEFAKGDKNDSLAKISDAEYLVID